MQIEKFRKYVLYLIAVVAVLRIFLAHFLELGNDEVYYLLYAHYPALSHFDHPLMVGWFIQIFSLNMLLDSELFMRLSSVFFSAINTYLIYLITSYLKDEKAGFFAAILYSTSFYTSIIVGVFILPDTPQIFFVLMAINFFVKSLPHIEIKAKAKKNVLFAGIFVGLAMISKYHSLFLWFGALLFIIFFNRRWLRTTTIYLSIFFSIVIFLPVIIWNIQNDFISFTFHGQRVNIFSSGLRMDFFASEILGEFFYNNPINFVLIIMAVVAYFKGKKFLKKEYFIIMITFSAPLIFLFLGFSLFRRTLPHWTGPAYIGLMIVAASYISDICNQKNIKITIPKQLILAIIFFVMVVSTAFLQIKTGLITQNKKLKFDITLDMYGWRQLGQKFEKQLKKDNFKINTIIANKWFPSANLDYYVCRKYNLKMLAIGELSKIHKYYWINKQRGQLQKHENVYFLSSDYNFTNPEEIYSNQFQKIIISDTIKIYRSSKLVKNFYVYKLIDFKN